MGTSSKVKERQEQRSAKIKKNLKNAIEKMDCKNKESVKSAMVAHFTFFGIFFSACRFIRFFDKKNALRNALILPAFLLYMAVNDALRSPEMGVMEQLAPIAVSLTALFIIGYVIFRFVLSRPMIANVVWILVLAGLLIGATISTMGLALIPVLWSFSTAKNFKEDEISSQELEKITNRLELLSPQNLISDDVEKFTIEELEKDNGFLNVESVKVTKQVYSGYRWTKPIELMKFSDDKRKTIYLDNFAYHNDILTDMAKFDGVLGGEVGTEITREQLEAITNSAIGKIAPIDFTKTIMAIGGMGSGKTEFFNSILDQDWYGRAVINDIKGDFTQKFYRPEKDILLNLYDKRSHYWDIFSEMKSNPQIVVSFISNLMMASVGGKPDFWLNSAKKILIDNFMKIGFSDMPSGDKYKALIDELERYKEEAGDDKTKSSIAVTMDLGIEIFQLIAFRANEENAKSFTLSEFFENNSGQRLFLLNNQAYSEKLTPYFVGFLGALTNTILGKADTKENLTFFLLDEFYSLKFEEDTRTKLLTAVRSKGGCIVAGMQYIDSKTETKQIMDSSRYAMLVFNVNDEVTVNRIISMFGDVEYREDSVSTSYGDKELGNTGIVMTKANTSVSTQNKSKKLITPQILQSMPKYTHLTIIPSEELLYLGYTKLVDKPVINENFEVIDMQNFYQSLFGDYQPNKKKPVQDDYSNYSEAELFSHWYHLKFANSEEELLDYIKNNNLVGLDVDRLYADFDENEEALKMARENYDNEQILKMMDDFFKIDNDKERYDFVKKYLLIGTLIALFKLDSDFVLQKVMENQNG